MKSSYAIRPECREDHAAIHDLTKRAFAPMPFAAGDEQDLIDALRELGMLTISIVAEEAGAVIGHAAFSPVSASDGSQGWFGLGPISVEPARQRQGIGKAMIADGLARLRERDAAGCIVVGDTGYYPRSGFQPRPDLAPLVEPPEYFMALALKCGFPMGRFAFHPAFYEKPS